MKTLTDHLIFTLITAIICGAVWVGTDYYNQSNRIQDTQNIMDAIHQQALYHGALEYKKHDSSAQGKALYSKKPKASWLPGNTQAKGNPFAPSGTPWIDIADPNDTSTHPKDPVLYSNTQAGFWYNPNNGTIRARIMPQISNTQTLKLYNQVNQAALPTLPHQETNTTQISANND